MRAYAIGDIHGQLGKLRLAHALIEHDRARTGDRDAPVVHIGDLVDRGPDSRGVIEFLIEGQAAAAPWIVLKGNHDRLMALWLEAPSRRDPCLRTDLDWLHPRMGGAETLASWGVDTTQPPEAIHSQARTLVPPEHRAFLSALLPFYRLDGLYFCHAGIRPGVALEDQVEDDLIWIRAAFHTSPADHGVLIVHGHTPVKEVTHYGNRVNIDTGAGWGRDLSVVVIEGQDVFVLTSGGRVPVRP